MVGVMVMVMVRTRTLTRTNRRRAILSSHWPESQTHTKPPASCLLPPASCLLPPASCLLPPASCLLPPAGGAAGTLTRDHAGSNLLPHTTTTTRALRYSGSYCRPGRLCKPPGGPAGRPPGRPAGRPAARPAARPPGGPQTIAALTPGGPRRCSGRGSEPADSRRVLGRLEPCGPGASITGCWGSLSVSTHHGCLDQ